MTDCKFSFAPFGDPGNVNIKVLLRTPATGRDMMATDTCKWAGNQHCLHDSHVVTASDAASMPCLNEDMINTDHDWGSWWDGLHQTWRVLVYERRYCLLFSYNLSHSPRHQDYVRAARGLT